MSGRHGNFGNAIHTTNGAGPHNLQLFVMACDGTVLTCLPGYWSPSDLAEELSFASTLNDVWTNPSLSADEKKSAFRKMHLAHVQQHSPAMVRRSRMQGFDQAYEAEHRPYTSDCIRDPRLVQASMSSGMKPPPQAFKTTDQIMHERMASRPFLPYERFDVAAYSDYGKPLYDKHEDARDARGGVDRELAKTLPRMGNPNAHGRGRMARYGQQEEARDPKLWGQATSATRKQWGSSE